MRMGRRMTVREDERAHSAPAASSNGWWVEFFRVMDTLDLDRVVAWYGDDIELRVGNEPAFLGKETASAALAYVFAQARSVGHELGTVMTSGDDVFIECRVRYDFKDAPEVTVPAAAY